VWLQSRAARAKDARTVAGIAIAGMMARLWIVVLAIVTQAKSGAATLGHGGRPLAGRLHCLFRTEQHRVSSPASGGGSMSLSNKQKVLAGVGLYWA
jgi:hypothetical protein